MINILSTIRIFLLVLLYQSAVLATNRKLFSLREIYVYTVSVIWRNLCRHAFNASLKFPPQFHAQSKSNFFGNNLKFLLRTFSFIPCGPVKRRIPLERVWTIIEFHPQNFKFCLIESSNRAQQMWRGLY